MIQYTLADLSSESEAYLNELQSRVNQEADQRSRYEMASRLFADKRSKPFMEVKSKLATASPPGNACFYCERDRYRDVDHIRPKRHYPEQCFSWTNYVYACTICNQDAKNDRYAVIQEDGRLIEFDRLWPTDRPIPNGIHALIDIRTENPLNYLILDLLTGRFVPMADAGISRQRAIYTRDLLRLDSDDLSRLRRQAVSMFTNYLERLKVSNTKSL